MNEWSKKLRIEHSPEIFRLYPNINFDELAQTYINLPISMSQRQRARLIDNIGIKYALCVIHKLRQHTDIDICQFYLTINRAFHPEHTSPEIKTSIQHLSDMAKNGTLPHICLSKGLTLEILNKIEAQIR